MTLYERAFRYGLDEELDNVIHAVEAWNQQPHRVSGMEAALVALVEAVDACDAAGGHEHGRPGEYEGTGGIRK